MMGKIHCFTYDELRAVSQLLVPVVCQWWLNEGMWPCGCDFFVVNIDELNGECWDVARSARTW